MTSPTTRIPGRRLSRRQALFLAGLLPVAVAGCSSGGGSGQEEGATREVATDRGPVQVPATPQRIVSLSGSLTGFLYTLEVPVVASDARLLGYKPDAAGFPATWSANATKAGTVALPPGDLSVEAVAAQRPDLIIGGGQGFTSAQATDKYDELSRIAPTIIVPSTAVAWQDQLRLIADAVGRQDRVAGLTTAYDDKFAQVKASIKPPAGAVAMIATYSEPKPYFITPTAVLPRMLTDLGFAIDQDALRKAGNPKLFGTGDSYSISPEILATVADTPNAFVVRVSGRTAAQLRQDQLYAQLPAFRANQVVELPPLSFRPDYAGIMQTLDILATTFR